MRCDEFDGVRAGSLPQLDEFAQDGTSVGLVQSSNHCF
jgi:hypothetical protein